MIHEADTPASPYAVSRTKLIASTDRLVTRLTTMDGRDIVRTHAGVPLLIVDGLLEPAPSLFFLWLAEHRSEGTMRAYAESLELWWRALKRTGIDWWEAIAEDLEAFQTIQSMGGASAATVGLRSAAIGSFYRWAFEHHLIVGMPFVIRTRGRGGRSGNGLAQGKTSQATVETPKVAKTEPKTHSIGEFNRILAALSHKDHGLRRRDELICECGRFMGLRRKEVAGLLAHAFVSMDTQKPVLSVALDPATTKGNKPRSVLAPRLMALKIQRFIDGYRRQIVNLARQKNPEYVEPNVLFLNDDGSPLKPEYVTKLWREASLAAGLPSNFHRNRHTSATAVADKAVGRGEQALLMVQQLHGHADINTSMIYVHQAELKEAIFKAAQIINDIYDHSQGVSP